MDLASQGDARPRFPWQFFQQLYGLCDGARGDWLCGTRQRLAVVVWLAKQKAVNQESLKMAACERMGGKPGTVFKLTRDHIESIEPGTSDRRAEIHVEVERQGTGDLASAQIL